MYRCEDIHFDGFDRIMSNSDGEFLKKNAKNIMIFGNSKFEWASGVDKS